MQHEIWYAGWGTLALINAGLAQSKHRSGLAGSSLSVSSDRSPRC
jgi:hypothetical protein